jgi:hypothetical protein
MKVSENEHKEIKILATKRGGTIKDLLFHLLEMYKNSEEADSYEFEELGEEDIKDLKAGGRAYEEGRYKTFEQVKEELPCQ